MQILRVIKSVHCIYLRMLLRSFNRKCLLSFQYSLTGNYFWYYLFKTKYFIATQESETSNTEQLFCIEGPGQPLILCFYKTDLINIKLLGHLFAHSCLFPWNKPCWVTRRYSSNRAQRPCVWEPTFSQADSLAVFGGGHMCLLLLRNEP